MAARAPAAEAGVVGDKARVAALVLDIAEAYVVALDREGRVTLANERLAQVVGWTAEELIGQDWFARSLPPSAELGAREALERCLAGSPEADEPLELPMLTRAGEIRQVRWQHTPLKDATGRVGLLCSGLDFTERHDADRALAASRRELEEMKQALDQASIVATTDQRGRIIYVNDRFCAISGYARDELMGQDHRIVNSGYHPREFFREMWRTIGQGGVWRGEIRNRAKDGHFYWVDTTIVPFLDERGRPYRYLSIRNDITERKRAEQRLREQAALATLGEMAAMVAHEVRNPLTGIGGAVQVIATRLPEASPERRVIGSIVERIKTLTLKLEDLLLYARPRTPLMAEVELGALLEETRALLADSPGQGEVVFERPATPVVVAADAALLREAVLNLLLNASQALDEAGITGRPVRLTLTRGERTCRIAVADEGPGIPPDVRDRVFQPFFTTRHKGTGLGLAIVRRMVEAHGGTVDLVCPPDGGTVMTIELPLADATGCGK